MIKKFWNSIKEMKISKKLLYILGGCAGALLIALLVILLIPSNRISRNLSNGDKFYGKENYETAIKKYQKAVDVHGLNVKGSLGVVRSKLALEEDASSEFEAVMEKLKPYFEEKSKGLEAKEGEIPFKHFISEEDFPFLTELLLLAGQAENDKDKCIEFLEAGYEYLDNTPDLNGALYDAYCSKAADMAENEPEVAAGYYEKAFLYGKDDQTTEKYSDMLYDYSLKLTDEGSFDKALEVLEDCKGKVLFDVEEALNSSLVKKEMYETKVNVLSKAYEALKGYYEYSVSEEKNETSPVGGMCDWDLTDMLMIDGSSEAEKIALSFSEDAYIWAPEGYTKDFSGIACGLYPYGETYKGEDGKNHVSYYFFYGNYENGIRKGYGISFAKSDATSFYGFEGNYENNSPNGEGTKFIKQNYTYTSLPECMIKIKGLWKDGLENGEMNRTVVLSEHPDTYFAGSYQATNGIAPGVSAATEDYEIINEPEESATLIAVLPSVDAGYNYYVPVYQYEGMRLSALGY